MKLKDGKYLKIEWDTNRLKVVDKKYMDKYMAKMLKEGLSGVTEKDEIEDVTRQYEWDSNNIQLPPITFIHLPQSHFLSLFNNPINTRPLS